MKPQAIEWIKDIKVINASSICEKLEEEVNSNNSDWQFSFDWKKMKEEVEKFMDDLDFHNIDLVTVYGNPWVYFSGCFTLEPWIDLGESEEEIMNWINQDFLRVVDDGEIKIKFVNSSKGETRLYRWFLRNDVFGYSNRTGWGGNIVASINAALEFVEKGLRSRLLTQADRLGDWDQIDSCEREYDNDDDDPGWQCLHDVTSCIWNNGSNTCNAPGQSGSPQEEE